MATTGKKGAFGFRLQSNPLPYASKNGDPSTGMVNYYPAAQFYKVPATSLGLAPQVTQNELEVELGQGLWPTGGYRAGYSGGGDISVQPRLEDNFGWLLYALTGSILCEFPGPTVDNGVREHVFMADESANAGNLPWLQMLRYDPSLGDGSDLWEIYDDCRVLSWAINIPAQAVATIDMSTRARVVGFLGSLKAIDRSMLVGPVAPAATVLGGPADSGSDRTLGDTVPTWDIGEHSGKTVYVEEAGLRDITTNQAKLLYISVGTVVAAQAYSIGIPVWIACSAQGTITTTVHAAATFAVDELNGIYVYISNTGWVLVTDTIATGLVFSGGNGYVTEATDFICIPTKAMGGTIRSARVSEELYTLTSVNDWLTVQGKGILRVNRKAIDVVGSETFYLLYVDGEFNEEVEDGDYIAVLDPTNATAGAGSTTVSMEDTVNLIVDNAYDEAFISIYDIDGSRVGETRVILTDGTSTVVFFEDAMTRAAIATDTYAIYDQEAVVTLSDAEVPTSIPLTSHPDTYFKVMELPFAGRKLPVRQVTVTMSYQALDPAQDTLLGAYEMDDITILSGRVELSFTYRIKSQALYNQILTGNSQITEQIARFSADILTTDAVVRTVAPTNIGTSTEKFGLEMLFPNVEWSMQGAPTLTGRDVVELNFRGLVRVGGNETLPTGITGATINASSGSITDADLDAAALGVAGIDTDDLVGKFIVIKSGTGAGQVRMISEYIDNAGADGVIIPHRLWVETPDGTSVFDIEDHYSVYALTNSRDAYATDIPSIDHA